MAGGWAAPWRSRLGEGEGDRGVAILGPSAREAPPGTDTINRLIAKVDGPVLLLFDELLNLFSRHRGLAAGCSRTSTSASRTTSAS